MRALGARPPSLPPPLTRSPARSHASSHVSLTTGTVCPLRRGRAFTAWGARARETGSARAKRARRGGRRPPRRPRPPLRPDHHPPGTWPRAQTAQSRRRAARRGRRAPPPCPRGAPRRPGRRLWPPRESRTRRGTRRRAARAGEGARRRFRAPLRPRAPRGRPAPPTWATTTRPMRAARPRRQRSGGRCAESAHLKTPQPHGAASAHGHSRHGGRVVAALFGGA